MLVGVVVVGVVPVSVVPVWVVPVWVVVVGVVLVGVALGLRSPVFKLEFGVVLDPEPVLEPGLVEVPLPDGLDVGVPEEVPEDPELMPVVPDWVVVPGPLGAEPDAEVELDGCPLDVDPLIGVGLGGVLGASTVKRGLGRVRWGARRNGGTGLSAGGTALGVCAGEPACVAPLGAAGRDACVTPAIALRAPFVASAAARDGAVALSALTPADAPATAP